MIQYFVTYRDIKQDYYSVSLDMSPDYITDSSNQTAFNIMKAVLDKHNSEFSKKLNGLGDFVIVTLTRIN